MSKTKPRPSASIALATALVLAWASAGSAQAQGQACLDKIQIQDAVSSGQILPLDVVLARAGVDARQSVLNVQVCDQGGQLVYIIGVLSPSGDAQNLVLNAR